MTKKEKKEKIEKPFLKKKMKLHEVFKESKPATLKIKPMEKRKILNQESLFIQ